MDKRKPPVPNPVRKMTTTALLLAAMMSLTPRTSSAADTIARTFFYNPPSNGGPPPDVLAMLAAGKTSGFQTFSTSEDSSRTGFSHLRSTAYTGSEYIPQGDPTDADPEFFQNLEVPVSDHNSGITWEPTKSTPGGESGGFWTTHLRGKEDLLPVVIGEDLSDKNPQRSELSKEDPERILTQDPQSSYESSTKIYTDFFSSTEMSFTPSTDKSFQTTEEIPENFSDDPEIVTGFPDGSATENQIQDLGNDTEVQEEDLLTSDNPVEVMTLDESDGEITTLISLVPDSYSDDENHYYKDVKRIQTKKEIKDEKKKELESKQTLGYQSPGDILKISNDTQENEYDIRDDIRTKTPIQSRMNSIFFTIDEGPNEAGEIKVKLGKSLDQSPSNQNEIEDKFKDIYQYNFHDPNTGWYKFGYGDNHQWRHEERSDNGVVLGRYGWNDANGQEHTTHFVADAKGYRVVKPGQKITMHVATTNTKDASNTNKYMTTARPSYTGKPTNQPSFSTTASFPITSVSTTVTLSTHASPNSLNRVSYPGTVSELLSPGQDISVVTGRPPIAYPLPQQSVSSRPGSWIFVPSTTRPFVRPPYRPPRPIRDRPIKSPFRDVNRNRHKQNIVRPLKPLQPNLKRGPKPEQEANDSKPFDEVQEEGINDSHNSKPSGNTDFIGQLQMFFNNTFKPLTQTTPAPPLSDNSEIISSGDFLQLINFINSFNGQRKAAGTPLDTPTWSKPQTNYEDNEKNLESTFHFEAPSPNLQPPPLPFSLSLDKESSSSNLQGAPHDESGDVQYPLDYAFMEEDYPIMGLNPFINQNKDKPNDGYIDALSLFGLVPSEGGSPDKNIGDKPWKIPALIPVRVDSNQHKENSEKSNGIGNNNIKSTIGIKANTLKSTTNPNGKNTSELVDSQDERTTLEPVTFIASSTKSSLSTKKATAPNRLISTSSEALPVNNVWPYIPISSNINSKPSPSNLKVTRPPPPPPPATQNFWTEVLKRLYYWPHSGSQDGQPTTIQ